MTTAGRYKDKRIVVMGLGRFGGGIGAARWLSGQGARVVVTDRSDESTLADGIASLAGHDVSFRLGGHHESDLDGCDLLVASPAVDKARSDFFHAATRRGIPWSSEMNLFLEHCPARIIGITGTVGKSTTTAMLETILNDAAGRDGWAHGRVWVGGNIGKSLLDNLAEMRSDDIAVLELSSFQLEDAAHIGRSPSIALITNIRDNHLDRHGTLDAYAAAKANIYRHQSEGGILAIPWDDDLPQSLADAAEKRPLYRFGIDAERSAVRIETITTSDRHAVEFADVALPVPGFHNLRNAAAALTLSGILGVEPRAAIASLAGFRGLPHRLEFVREHGGVRYYNDSKATTPEAAITAIAAFDRPVVVIVGGSDKGASFAELVRVLADRVQAVIAVGATRDRIIDELHLIRDSAQAPANAGMSGEVDSPEDALLFDQHDSDQLLLGFPLTRRARSFEAAVDAARNLAAPGDVVLLSPACASFDMFRSYEQRGAAFVRQVNSWG